MAVGRVNRLSPGSDRKIMLSAFAFAVVILTIPIGRAPIWEPNNARWVLLARDMVERGHWLAPEIRGAPNEGLYKPPLFSWAIALASLPTGRVTELTAVLPSLVSAIIGVVGVFAIGRQLWNVRAGALAAIILTTTSNYFALAQQSLADVMMTASMVWALHFLLRARDGSSFGLLVGFYGCIGTAMLCKGPPGLSALAAAVVAAGVEGGRSAVRRLRPGVGALVLAAFALPWVVPYLAGPRAPWVHDVLLGEYAGWFFRTTGITFRLAHMPLVLVYFLPWTLFLLPAVFWWRRDGPDEGRRWVLWWTLTLWILVGLSGAYRGRYFLPVYPGLALLVGEFFARAVGPAVRRTLRLAAIAFAVLMSAVLIATASPPQLSGEGPVYMPDTIPERLVLAVLATIGMVGVLGVSRRDTSIGAGVFIATVIGAILAVEGFTSPMRRARFYDISALGAAATAHTAPGRTTFGYPDLSLEYEVYIHWRIVEIDSRALRGLLAGPARDVVILTRKRWAEVQAHTVSAAWQVLESRTVGGTDVVVIGGSSGGDGRSTSRQ